MPGNGLNEDVSINTKIHQGPGVDRLLHLFDCHEAVLQAEARPFRQVASRREPQNTFHNDGIRFGLIALLNYSQDAQILESQIPLSSIIVWLCEPDAQPLALAHDVEIGLVQAPQRSFDHLHISSHPTDRRLMGLRLLELCMGSPGGWHAFVLVGVRLPRSAVAVC